MNAITLLLIPARVEATLAILSLLLVSTIIGYVTAWLYFRYKYRTEAQALESIIEQQKQHATTVTDEIGSLQKRLGEINRELDQTKNENKKLKELLKNVPNEDTNQSNDNLRMISGIGPFIEERLHAMNIHSFKQISRFSQKDIEKMGVAIEYFNGRIERDEWVTQAKELVAEETREAALSRIRDKKTQIYFNRIGIASKLEANNLTSISGIGGWIEQKLNILDIYTFRQIANFNNEDIETVTNAIEFFPGRIERDEWVHQAKDLMKIEGEKDVLLHRISEKKGAISHTNKGETHKQHANNLTLIKGISLWIEERLNVLNIYTFEQISKFTDEDVKMISEILEISQTRIQNDNWVQQAKELQLNKNLI